MLQVVICCVIHLQNEDSNVALGHFKILILMNRDTIKSANLARNSPQFRVQLKGQLERHQGTAYR